MKYRIKIEGQAKEKRIALGIYPDTSLKEAENKCIETKKLLKNNLDPLAVRKDAKRAAEIKKQVPNTTPSQINNVIKTEKMKGNKRYAAHNFRYKKHADEHKKNGRVPSGTPTIYTQAAIDFAVKKLLEGA